MTDIYDIKDILLSFPINITYSLIYLIFVFLLFIIYKKINNKSEIIVEEKEKVIIEKKDYNKILNDFKREYIKGDKDVFYSKLLFILRDILEYKGEKNISKMTFKEISNLSLNNELKDFIKSIYYKEYMKEIDDNDIIREKFIEDIKKIIK